MTSNSGLLDFLIVGESPGLETHVTPIPAAQNHVVLVYWASTQIKANSSNTSGDLWSLCKFNK